VVYPPPGSTANDREMSTPLPHAIIAPSMPHLGYGPFTFTFNTKRREGREGERIKRKEGNRKGGRCYGFVCQLFHCNDVLTLDSCSCTYPAV